MKKLLVLVLVVCCSCSFSFDTWGQMQDPGTTTTSVIEEQGGDVQEVTETTVTIENKTTGDILDGDTGVVTTRYEGDMDLDWGGIGTASMVTCPSQVGGTGKCAKGTSSTLTTFQQNINIAQFHIEDGGALNWSLDAWHSQNNTELYFELIPFDQNLAQKMSDKAVNILRATEVHELLPKISSDPAYFECRFCPWSNRCQEVSNG